MVENQSAASELKYESCEKCGEPKYIEIELFGNMKLMPRMCKCSRDEYNSEVTRQANKEKQIRLDKLFKNSLMDKSFLDRTFDNWDFQKGSRKMYNMGIRYSNKFKEIKENGIGLMLHGKPGNGKTYLSCCIANKLLQDFIPVVCVSINGLLGQIKETYNRWGDQAEADILRGICNADLLIIDDLGTEQVNTWTVPMIYNIIDSRYRSKLPLIITTNLDIDTTKTGGVLSERYGRRTEDRILEMCTPVENSGDSIRIEEAKKKTSLLRGILDE